MHLAVMSIDHKKEGEVLCHPNQRHIHKYEHPMLKIILLHKLITARLNQ